MNQLPAHLRHLLNKPRAKPNAPDDADANTTATAPTNAIEIPDLILNPRILQLHELNAALFERGPAAPASPTEEENDEQNHRHRHLFPFFHHLGAAVFVFSYSLISPLVRSLVRLSVSLFCLAPLPMPWHQSTCKNRQPLLHPRPPFPFPL